MVFISFRMLIINSFTKHISVYLFTNNTHGNQNIILVVICKTLRGTVFNLIIVEGLILSKLVVKLRSLLLKKD